MGIELNMKASSCLEDELMMAVEVVSFVAYPDFGLLEWSFWRRFPQENDDLLQQDVSRGCPASLKEGRRLLWLPISSRTNWRPVTAFRVYHELKIVF